MSILMHLEDLEKYIEEQTQERHRRHRGFRRHRGRFRRGRR